MPGGFEGASFRDLGDSEDLAAGIAAFAEKCCAEFKGR
jgi:hypothetical protein